MKYTKMKATVNSAKSQITTYEFIFCCLFGEKDLKQKYNLSRTLQYPTTSASQGNQVGM